MKKISTGIEKLDRILQGGIMEGLMVLVEGEPGAGKSNLGLEFLYRGAINGQNSLFVSFQNTEDEILKSTTFDWRFDEMVEKDRINIRKMDPYRYEQVPDMLRGVIRENNARRVVMDPITDLDLYIDSRKDVRKNLLSIKQELENSGATALMMGESKEATSIEEEVCDGIIQMDLVRDENSVGRELAVRKMAGSDFSHDVHKYDFNSNGIKIQ